jgi:hypothetical protein
MANDDRSDICVLGRNIGTYTGWDVGGNDAASFVIYDFVPHKKCKIPGASDILVNYREGTVDIFDAAGKVAQSFNLIDVVIDCPIWEDGQ